METNAGRDKFQPPVEHEESITSLERNTPTVTENIHEEIDSLGQIQVTQPYRDKPEHGESTLKGDKTQPGLSQTILDESIKADSRIPRYQHVLDTNESDQNLREHDLSRILQPLENHSEYTENFNNYKICRFVAPGVTECLILETGEHIKWDKNNKLCKMRENTDEDLLKNPHLEDCRNIIPVESADCSVGFKTNQDPCFSQCNEIPSDVSLYQNIKDVSSEISTKINQSKRIFKITKDYTDDFANDSRQRESQNCYPSFREKPLGAIPKNIKGIDSATDASAQTNASTTTDASSPTGAFTPTNASTPTCASTLTESESSSHQLNDNFIYGIYILEEYLKDMQSLCKKNWQIIQRAKDVFYNQLLPSGLVSHKDDFLVQRSLNEDCPELNKSTYFIPKTFLRLGFQQSLQSNISIENLQSLTNQPEESKKDITSPLGTSSLSSSSKNTENICKSQQENSGQNTNNTNIFQLPFQNSEKFKILEENRILKNELKHFQSSLSVYEKHLSGAKEQISKLNERNEKLDNLIRDLNQENKVYREMINSLRQREEKVLSEDGTRENLVSTLKMTDNQDTNENKKRE